MLNFCPECGVKLEKEFKFCPNCGSNLKEAVEEGKTEKSNLNLPEEKPGQKSTIKCDNCGEENSINSEVCSGCGAKLKNSNATKKEVIQPLFVERKKEKKTSKKTRPVNQKSIEQPKTLNQKAILITIASVIGIVFIILIASGVFNSESFTDGTPTSQTQSSGVNLQNAQKISQLQEQLSKNPGDAHIALELANLQFDSGLYQTAVPNYKSYLAAHPEDADARVDLGVCYFNMNNDSSAMKEMETALKYNPQHQIAMMNLGIVNLRTGNMQKAKEWLEKAVKINPNNEIGKKANELLKSHNTN